MLVGLPFQIYVTRTLGPESFGLFGLVEAAMVTISGLLAFGIAPTALRFIPEHLANSESTNVRRLAVFGAATLLTIGLLAATAITALSRPLGAWWEIKADITDVIAVLAFLVPLSLVNFFLQQVLRGLHEIVLMVVATSVIMLCVKIATTVALFSSGLGVVGYALALIVGQFVGVTVMALAVVRLLGRLPMEPTPAPAPFRRWLRYAGVLYANELVGVATFRLDRFIVGAFLGPSSVAVLMVAQQLRELPNVLYRMFLTVVAPMFAESNRPSAWGRRKELYHLTTDWVVRLSLPLVLFLAVMAEPLLSLYGREFADKGTMLLWLCLAAVSVTIGTGPSGNLLIMSGLELNQLRLSAASSILTFALYVVLVPVLGLPGVGISLIAAALYLNAAALRLVHRRLSFHWWSERYRRWMAPGLAAAAALVAVRVLGNFGDPVFAASWLAIAFAAAFVSALVANLVAGLGPDDRILLEALRTRLRRHRSGIAP